MQGNVEINGIEMTPAQLVELYLKTKNDLDTANKVLEARKQEFDFLTMRCIPSARVDFENHVFGNLVIIPNSKYEELRNKIEELETELRVKEDLFAIKGAISDKKINLNDIIKVKLTPLGADIFYHQYDKLNKDYKRAIIEPHLPKVDEKGYTKFQLHHFMELYGEHIGMAKPNVIEPLDIILCE